MVFKGSFRSMSSYLLYVAWIICTKRVLYEKAFSHMTYSPPFPTLNPQPNFPPTSRNADYDSIQPNPVFLPNLSFIQRCLQAMIGNGNQNGKHFER